MDEKMRLGIIANHGSLAEEEARADMILAVKYYEERSARARLLKAMANGDKTEDLSAAYIKARNEAFNASMDHALVQSRVVEYEEELFRRYGIEVSYERGGLQI